MKKTLDCLDCPLSPATLECCGGWPPSNKISTLADPEQAPVRHALILIKNYLSDPRHAPFPSGAVMTLELYLDRVKDKNKT